MAGNVYEVINKVQGDLAKIGISKSDKNQTQGYMFRGIDAIYNTLAPLLSQHGLVILPFVLSREVSERQTKSGGVMFYTTVESEFSFVSMHDGSKHVVKTYGEAMDSGDKSTNKAMSAAYKYACMQAFCIPTEGDNDADQTTHEIATEKFSAEDKSTQATVITKIALCKDQTELDSLMEEYQGAVSALPDTLQGDINNQMDIRQQQIAKGINPTVTSHKYSSVNDAIKWMTDMKPIVEGFKTIKQLDVWENYHRPFLSGLDCLKADKYKKDGKTPRERMLDAIMQKRVELESTQTPIG